MIEIDAHRFLEVYNLLCGSLTVLSVKKDKGTWGIMPSSHEELTAAVDFIEYHARVVGLPLTMKSIVNLKSAVGKFQPSGPGYIIGGEDLFGLQRYLDEVVRRARDEHSTLVMLTIPYTESRYYEEGEAYFGSGVTSKFPSATYEMDEASKCFALNRHTASVFHLMRLLEVAINAVRKCLGIPDPVKPAQRNWGNILSAFRAEIDRRNAQSIWPTGMDRSFFEEVSLLLSSVKDAWRNSTMHIDRVYNREEALQILTGVRSLMQKIAARMDESGDPKA